MCHYGNWGVFEEDQGNCPKVMATPWPKMYYGAQNDYTHIFSIWELICQLHRTSVTHAFRQEFFCVSWAPMKVSIFQLHTHISVTQKSCFRSICVIMSGRIGVVTGEHWTGSPNKNLDQMGKIVQEISENCVFSPSGQLLDIFRHFFGHFVDIPFFWAVQRFARYNIGVCP